MELPGLQHKTIQVICHNGPRWPSEITLSVARLLRVVYGEVELQLSAIARILRAPAKFHILRRRASARNRFASVRVRDGRDLKRVSGRKRLNKVQKKSSSLPHSTFVSHALSSAIVFHRFLLVILFFGVVRAVITVVRETSRFSRLSFSARSRLFCRG